MSKLFFVLLACIGFSTAFAQHTVSGTIAGENAQPVTDASIYLLDEKERPIVQSLSGEGGKYQLNNLKTGSYSLVVLASGFRNYRQNIMLTGSQVLDVKLNPLSIVADDIVVSGVRAKRNSPTTFTEMSKKDLDEKNFGQDFPYLLSMTPSAIANSDAGNGVGYTDLRIRGVDATRINITINGIPLNDAESQGVFLVNLPDFASSTQSLQVQRGVGTSTNGAGAFGASINIQSLGVSDSPYAEINNAYGSFNTHKHNVQFGTGLMPNKWAFDGRLSMIGSDGYIDRASSNLQSYYFSAGRYTARNLFKFVTFSGREITYQSWYGVPEAKLSGNRADLDAQYNANLGYLYNTREDSVNLYNSDPRTYNYYTYKNQVDNYRQTHYQAFYDHRFNSSLVLNTALHFTHGEGYYEEYKPGDELADYNLPPVAIGGDTITNSDIIRRRWLNNDFYGLVFSLNYNKNKVDFTFGGGIHRYDGNHYGEVTWAQYASTSFIGYRYYDNDAHKTDGNLYAKLNYQFNRRVSGYLDLQGRMIDYSFLGYNNSLENIQQDANYFFFNPKAGLVYTFDPINKRSNLYLSYSQASREPTRDDFTQSSASSRPKPETLHDVELGYRHMAGRYSFTVNGFLMYYRNQLILTGQINDVGAYNRVNVPESYRSGVELAASVNILRQLQWTGNFTYSLNKIMSFTEYVDDYDNGGQIANRYTNTDIALSPGMIAASQFRYIPEKGWTIDLLSKYVSRQYLDNTQNSKRSIDPYFLNDVRIAWQSGPLTWIRFIRAGVQLNNIFNVLYESKGYTYAGMSGGVRYDNNYYYPQAGFNMMTQLTLGF